MLTDCIERGYHWVGDGNVLAGGGPWSSHGTPASPEECQKKCEQLAACTWFNWGNADFPNGCWLQDNKGARKDSSNGRDKGATGPKVCTGKKKVLLHIVYYILISDLLSLKRYNVTSVC